MNSDLQELGGRDPHALLGVQHGASERDVVRAFRHKAARGGHPDTGGDERTFRQLTRARDVLLDSDRLSAYAATRRTGRVQYTSPSPFSQGQTAASREPSGNNAGAVRAEPRRSTPPVPTEMNVFAAITLVLVLLGPLAWPLALVTGLLALWTMGRSRRRQPRAT